MIPLRINLEPEEIPTHWYNVAADLTNPPAPPLAPDGSVVTPAGHRGRAAAPAD